MSQVTHPVSKACMSNMGDVFTLATCCLFSSERSRRSVSLLLLLLMMGGEDDDDVVLALRCRKMLSSLSNITALKSVLSS